MLLYAASALWSVTQLCCSSVTARTFKTAVTAQLLLQPQLQEELGHELLLATALWSCTIVLDQALHIMLSGVCA